MKSMRIRVFALAAALTLAMTLLVGVSTASAHEGRDHKLKANMTGAAEIAGGDLNAKGTTELRLNPGRGTVCFDIDVSGLSAPITAAHIHQGVAGKNGPVVVDFMFKVNGLNNCVSADPALISSILKDPAGFYTNVHTTAF